MLSRSSSRQLEPSMQTEQFEQPRQGNSPTDSRSNNDNDTNLDDESSKSHRCGQCPQAFARADHLKRHLLSHTGLKSYSCQFCRQRFSRSDRRQRHYERCALRGDGEIPRAAPKGRRRHACYNCISMKVQCDGGQPCSSCRKRGSRCAPQSQSHAPTISARVEDGSSRPGRDPTQTETPTERISINTLLATGTDGFTKPCNFPSQEGQVTDASPQGTIHVGISSDELNAFDGVYSHLTDIWPDEDLAFFDEAFTSVVNFPIPYQGLSFLDTAAAGVPQIGYMLPENVEMDGSPTTLSSYQRVEPPHVEALRDCLLSKLHDMNIREDRMGDIMRDLTFFFAADGIERFTALYFENWHKNGPILHRPLFSPSATRTSLLLAVVIFGAMYSTDPQEHRIAAYLLDVAELVIFSTPPFSCTANMATKLNNEPGTLPSPEADAWEDFEDLQAAYLISTVQYWAGDQSGRNRVIENRFSDIVQVARKLGLTKIRHTLQDRISEYLWIRKERQVRTMYMIRLFDCAFIFYSNYPCILTFAELRTDLPCESSLFEAEHPFSQEDFCFSRNTTASDTLRVLFQASDPVAGARAVQTPMTASLFIEHAGKSSPRDITLQDLYLLVHLICIMIQMRSALFSPLADVQELYIETAPEQRRDWNSLIERALCRWHSFWETMRANTAPEQWEAAGMYKNSYNIWRVARLLHDKQEVVNSLRRLDVPCSDKLTELKVLLSGDE